MRFWDSSAIVPLVLDEPASERVLGFTEDNDGFLVWWGTIVECASAIARRERDNSLAPSDANLANDRLRELQEAWREITPSARVRALTLRLLRAHALRAADAFQLAAALVVSEDEPRFLQIVCLDGRLAAASRREGFEVVP